MELSFVYTLSDDALYNSIQVELWFLFPAHRLMMLYNFTNSGTDIFIKFQSYGADMIYDGQQTDRQTTVENKMLLEGMDLMT